MSNDETIIPQINDPIVIFPEDLDKKFEEYSSTVSFEDLPKGQFIHSNLSYLTRTFKT